MVKNDKCYNQNVYLPLRHRLETIGDRNRSAICMQIKLQKRNCTHVANIEWVLVYTVTDTGPGSSNDPCRMFIHRMEYGIIKIT